MEKDRAPPSPVQQCHHPSKSAHSSSPPPGDSESNKLNLPSPVANASSDLSSNHSSQTSQAESVWPTQEAERLAFLDGKRGDGEPMTSLDWQITPSGPDVTYEASSPQPLASSSRCLSPSPALSRSPSPQPPNALLSLNPSHLGPSLSGLLTSEPLNRASSQSISPDLALSFSNVTPKKRGRASSLPLSTPIFKRLKRGQDVPTPSDTWSRSMAHAPPGPSRAESAQRRAERFRREFGLRPAEDTPKPKGWKTIVASRPPPINLVTLKALDAREILKNPQLRHDLLFDALAFRPVGFTMSITFTADEIRSGRAAAAPGPARTFPPSDMGNNLSDIYWESIGHELTRGCRCTRWHVAVRESDGKPDGTMLQHRVLVDRCLCGGWMRGLSEEAWWESQSKWPSRLPEMIKTLREILLSLMGSTTPCVDHYKHSYSKTALEQHELTCPTITHALVPEISNALDPKFLTIQVRRGVFSTRIFEVMGEAMKVHCAPVRDRFVNDMVATAVRGELGQSLRKCFDCVEVMKLDIANHQVFALRPYLWSAAPDVEYTAFRSRLSSASLTLETSVTREWFRAASMRVLAATPVRDRQHMLAACRCPGFANATFLCRSLADGFIELAFDPEWKTCSSSWPPAVQRRRSSQSNILPAASNVVPDLQMPESFKLDSRRIRDFHVECVEATIVGMIAMMVRNLARRTFPSLRENHLGHILHKATETVEYFLKLRSPLRPTELGAEPCDLAFRLACLLGSGSPPDPLRAGTSGLMLRSSDDLAQIMTHARTLDGFLYTHLADDQSPLFQVAFRKMKVVMHLMIRNKILGWRADPNHEFYEPRWRSPCLSSDTGSSATATHEIHTARNEASPNNTPLTSPPGMTSSTIAEDSLPRVQTEVLAALRQTDAAACRSAHAHLLTSQEEEENDLLLSSGLEIMASEIRKTAKSMEKMLKFHLSVFAEVYSRRGMLLGSQRRGISEDDETSGDRGGVGAAAAEAGGAGAAHSEEEDGA